MNNLKINWADVFGIISSSLCIIHCLAMPILIATGVGFLSNDWVSYLFLLLSFLSISKVSYVNTSRKNIFILWFSFLGLLIITFLHDTYEWMHTLSYFFALGIIIGHILNIKQCNTCKR